MVVDASVLLSLVLDQDGQDPARKAILADPNIALPPLWRYEVAHVLWRKHREGVLGPAALESAMARLHGQFEGKELPVSLPEALAAARRYGLSSAYDASYVALAEKLGCGLLTLDQELLRKVPWARGVA